MKTATKVCLFLVFALVVLVGYMTGTKKGKQLTSKAVAGYLHGQLNYVGENKTERKEVKNETKEEMTSGQYPKDEKTDESEEKAYYHILLLGEEALKSSPGKGRTDTMILATVDTVQKRVVLTSVLRDTYVEPEGMNPCKINAVYARLGVNGLYEILYEKIGILPDGYMKVGFDDFKKIIDMLGGAEVMLTQEEAEYLNTHDYISKEEYRTVVAGEQVLNGNQTLGYCRVRFVPNCNGTKYDYGRTERQRMVLSNLFERYKAVGLTKKIKIAEDALGYIETDIDETLMEDLIYVAYEGRITKLEQRQLPAEGTFRSEDKGAVTSALEADWERNKEIFWSIFE